MTDTFLFLFEYAFDCVDAGAMLVLQDAIMQQPRIKDRRMYYLLTIPLAALLYFCNNVLAGMTGVILYPIVEIVLMVYLFRDRPVIKRVAAPLVVMVIQIVATYIAIGLISILAQGEKLVLATTTDTSPATLFMTILSRTIVILAVYGIAHAFAKMQHRDAAVPQEGLFLVIPLLSIVMGLVIIDQTFQGFFSVATYLLITALLIAVNVFAFIAMRIAAKATQASMQERAVNTIQTLQQEQYRQILERSEETRRWKHDMNNHISTGVELIRSGKSSEAADYLTKVMDSVQESTFIIQSGNTVLDAILSAKLSECQNAGIKVSIDASIPNVLVSDIDACTIFGNLFDNAINACKLLPEAERKLQFTMKPGDNFTVITLINKAPAQQSEQDWKRTRKGELHGVGLSQVRRVAEKYNGLFTSGQENGVWTSKLALPTPQDVIWLRTYSTEI